MGQSKIEWTEATWNPVTGCTKCSPGCANCYAEKVAYRLKAMGTKGYENGFAVTLHPERLQEPLRWRKPRMVFVCSMGDLFHEDVPLPFAEAVLGVIAACPQHKFQLLTKRPDRMAKFFRTAHPGGCANEAFWRDVFATKAQLPKEFPKEWPLPNLWLGVTVCNQQEADEKIPLLLQIPAAVRFVSIEPMLESIQLGGLAFGQYEDTGGGDGIHPDIAFHDFEPHIDWVICGGETGHGARPMHPQWTRDLRDQCKAADVPFFFKGWGDWLPISQMPDGHADTLYHPAPKRDPESIRQCKVAHSVIQAVFPMGAMTVFRVGKKAAGRFLDGVEHSELPGQEVAK
jgi:protein gp37